MEVSTPQNSNEDPDKKNHTSRNSEYSGYFQSREHELAFYFKINNVIFDKPLGIKKIHLTDANKAKELRNSYLRIFHPDRKGTTENGLNYNEICADIEATFHRVSGGKL